MFKILNRVGGWHLQDHDSNLVCLVVILNDGNIDGSGNEGNPSGGVLIVEYQQQYIEYQMWYLKWYY